METAIEITTKGPIGVRMAKKAISKGYQVSFEEGLVIEKDCYAKV